jgi:hypothetical protein
VKEKVELAVTDGTRMTAYVARPEQGGPHPGILLFQEAFGVNRHIRSVRASGLTTRRIKKQFLLFLGAEGGRGTRDKLQGSAEECANGEMGTGVSSALWIRNDW